MLPEMAALAPSSDSVFLCWLSAITLLHPPSLCCPGIPSSLLLIFYRLQSYLTFSGSLKAPEPWNFPYQSCKTVWLSSISLCLGWDNGMDLEKIWLDENKTRASGSKILLLMNSDLDQNCQRNLCHISRWTITLNFATIRIFGKTEFKCHLGYFFSDVLCCSFLTVISLVLDKYVLSNSASLHLSMTILLLSYLFSLTLASSHDPTFPRLFLFLRLLIVDSCDPVVTLGAGWAPFWTPFLFFHGFFVWFSW